MPKELERDLGLYATLTISIGAMIGSGIFVLPGLASKIAGPAVILAYFLAGVVVLPAALSKAEMATAMPEAGGTYLYIDRAMGPLPGTIAGVGAWFSLVFKSAFALVGLGAYLLIFVSVPTGAIKLIGLVLAVLLLAVNVVGVKQSGRLQAAIVSLVLLSLLVFIGDGLTYVNQPRYHPFLKHGSSGLLAATGFVFVSYAGVTKIASVAEEVEDPGRTIPRGILGSIALMMLVYTFVAFVVVGVAPADELAHTLTPMALAAEAFLGRVGEVGIAVVAVLALTSMANAGILSSSRFPLAMSRDSLAPPSLSEVHERFRTPVYAIGFTGAVLLLLIAFVPVIELAKLASAFQILVFSFVNVALIAFRESDLQSYNPEFIAPGYPWVQLFGIVAGFVLLTQMGMLALLGALGLILGGVAWYHVYGRERTEREGAALDALRHTTEVRSLAQTRQAFASGGDGGALIAVGPETPRDRRETLLRLAEPIVKRRGGEIHVVRFEEVPEQVTLSHAASEETEADASFEAETDEFLTTAAYDVPVQVDEVVSHDTEHAVVNRAKHSGVNLILGEWESERYHGELLGEDVDWYIKHAPSDLVFVRNRGLDAIGEIAVTTEEGPYDPLEILIADALAQEHDARIRFLYALGEDATEDQQAAARRYHDALRDLCSAPVSYDLIHRSDRVAALEESANTADLTIVSTSAHHLLYDVVFGTLGDDLATELDTTVLLVHSQQTRRHTFIRYLLNRFVF